MMDLGATICTPKKPACVLCPWNEDCAAHARSEAEIFPRRTPKREGALRRGAAFVVRRRDGFLLVRTRPPRGLLGGMTEVPTTEWLQDFDDAAALASAPRLSRAQVGKLVEWRRLAGVVRHAFTHFPLELAVYLAEAPPKTTAPTGMRWVALDGAHAEAFPSLMRKVLAHALRKETIES
jgi:A/G-specific adenine glycosylase